MCWIRSLRLIGFIGSELTLRFESGPAGISCGPRVFFERALCFTFLHESWTLQVTWISAVICKLPEGAWLWQLPRFFGIMVYFWRFERDFAEQGSDPRLVEI